MRWARVLFVVNGSSISLNTRSPPSWDSKVAFVIGGKSVSVKGALSSSASTKVPRMALNDSLRLGRGVTSILPRRSLSSSVPVAVVAAPA